MDPLCLVRRAIGHQLSLPSLRGQCIPTVKVWPPGLGFLHQEPHQVPSLPSCVTNHLLCSALLPLEPELPAGREQALKSKATVGLQAHLQTQ